MKFKNRNLRRREGETRVVKKFLLIPRMFNSEYGRWLEYANIVERVMCVRDLNCEPEWKWIEIGFADEIINKKRRDYIDFYNDNESSSTNGPVKSNRIVNCEDSNVLSQDEVDRILNYDDDDEEERIYRRRLMSIKHEDIDRMLDCIK